MAIFDLGFKWRVDDKGYDIDKREPEEGTTALTGNRGEYIVRLGGRLTPTEPMGVAPTLFMDFAKLDGSADSCKEFASRRGYLGLNDSDDDPAGESLVSWRTNIKKMHRAIKIWEANPDWLLMGGRNEIHVTKVSVLLIPTPPDGSPAMHVRPTTLLSAMWLQFAGALHAGAVIRPCKQCGEWFGAGGDFRKIDAKFCKDKCKTDYHNARKGKAS